MNDTKHEVYDNFEDYIKSMYNDLIEHINEEGVSEGQIVTFEFDNGVKLELELRVNVGGYLND